LKRAEEILYGMVEVGMCRRKGACAIDMNIQLACTGRTKAKISIEVGAMELSGQEGSEGDVQCMWK
jgi:activator of HSP90 ATPase